MPNVDTNGLLIVLGVVNLCILVFALPHLCEGTVCRVATLFAGLHAGTLTSFLFLDDWASSGDIDRQVLTKFLLATLPKIYIPALMIGAFMLPKYVLSAPNHLAAICWGLIAAVVSYLSTYFVAGIVDLGLRAYLGRPFPSDGLTENLMVLLQHTFQMDRYFTTISIVSALVSMVGAVAIAQKAERSAP